MKRILVRPESKGRWVKLACLPEGFLRMWAENGFRLLSPWSVSEWDTVDEQPKPGALDPVAWLCAIFKQPKVTGMETIEQVMNTFEIAGAVLRLEGETIKVAPPPGGMTEELRQLIRTHKPAIVAWLKEKANPTPAKPEQEPWDDARVAVYMRQAREDFKGMFDVVASGKDDRWREAAFSILVDSVAMLAESVAHREMGIVIEKAGYISWLCRQVRTNLERLRSSPGMAFNERAAS